MTLLLFAVTVNPGYQKLPSIISCVKCPRPGRKEGLFTAWCTTVQSTVLWSHVVCLPSVCPPSVDGLWWHGLEFFKN